jgi:xanthine/uracil/vitamin C permease (AzgA family)
MPGAGPLDRFFGLSAAGSSVATELRAGLATFLTMAYIMFVNPAILQQAGMDHGAVFVATCLAEAAGSLIIGLYANYPIALAPGMGLNAYFISPSPWCPSSAATGSSHSAAYSSPACCSFSCRCRLCAPG